LIATSGFPTALKFIKFAPDPLQRSPDPLAGLWGSTFKGRERRVGGTAGQGRRRKGGKEKGSGTSPLLVPQCHGSYDRLRRQCYKKRLRKFQQMYNFGALNIAMSRLNVQVKSSEVSVVSRQQRMVK